MNEPTSKTDIQDPTAGGAGKTEQATTPDTLAGPTGTVDFQPGERDTALAGHAFSGKDTARSGAAAPAADTMTGVSVGGYDLLERLGQGAMGVVYKARQPGLKRLVALKMISAGACATEEERARFRAEAEAAAALRHPNIVQIYEIGEHNGLPFISLELVTGGNLARKIADTPQPARYAAEVVLALAGAMQHAHNEKIIHRDLKPGNVLLAEDGTPKIADFGLAKSLEGSSVQTQTGAIVGTPSYMAPEQAEGKTKEIGPAADIYALGAVLYDLVTGRPPFRGTSLWDTVAQVKVNEPVPPGRLQPGLPADLETICLKCLRKEAARRYATANELAEDLSRFLAGEAIRGRPVSAAERLWRWCRRNPVPAALTAAAVLLLVLWGLTATVLAWRISAETEEKDRQWRRAEDNARAAKESEKTALENEQKARRSEEKAVKNAEFANKNFHYASTLLQNNVYNIRKMVERLNAKLQPKPGQSLGPEATALRQELLEVARDTITVMARDFAKAGLSQFDQVLVHQSMGDLLLQLGEVEQAREQYQLGTTLMQKFAQERPGDSKVQGNLALMFSKLGEATLLARGDAAAAAELFGEAFAAHEVVWKALPEKPTTPQDQQEAAHQYARRKSYYGQLAGAAGLMWGPAGSRRALQGPLAFWEERARAKPKDLEARSYLAQTNSLLGDACSWSGDWEAARRHHEAAVALCEALIADFPKDYTLPADLCFICTSFGDAYARVGRPEKAHALHTMHLADAEKSLAREPRSLWVKMVLARCYERLGEVDKALPLREELARLAVNDMSHQSALCVALARVGKLGAARDRAEALLKRAPKHPEVVIETARCFALGAAASRPVRAQFQARAVALLGQAVGQGYRNVLALEQDGDWQAIRGTAGFADLLNRARK
jgi:serine/threonine-protein kinase